MTRLEKAYRHTVDAYDRGHAFGISRFHIIAYIPDHRNDRYIRLFRPSGHADYHFAAKALSVDLALSGQNHVRTDEFFIKSDGIQYGLYPHLQLRAEKCEHSRAHRSGGPRARNVRQIRAEITIYYVA